MHAIKKITKEKIILLIIAIILIASFLSILIPHLPLFVAPKVTNIIPSPIQYGAFESYSISPDGKYLYTDTYDKIDIETGQLVDIIPGIVVIKNILNQFELKTSFSTFSLSPDEKYLIMADLKESTVIDEDLKFLEMGKIVNFQTREFKYIPDDLIVYSWNPNDSNVFLSNYGFVKINEDIENITYHFGLDGWDEFDYRGSKLMGNAGAVWDITNNIPIILVQENNNIFQLVNVGNIEYKDFTFPINLFKKFMDQETNVIFGFDPSGQYLIYEKIESNLDTSIWVIDWQTLKQKEIFRMSDYDSEMPVITDAVLSSDGTRILIERKDSNFIILELSSNER
jgi:hypothetical protein